MINEWKLLYRYQAVEIWKTPTKYLTCIKYNKIFKFFDTIDEATTYAKSLLK